MVVVGIVGILVAIAIPNYQVYQRKTLQAEAKIAVSQMYAGQKAFYVEYSAYIPNLDAIGYEPTGLRRFYIHQACSSGLYAGSVTGFTPSTNRSGYWFLNNPHYTGALTFPAGHTCNPGGAIPWFCAQYGDDHQVFQMAAVGVLFQGATVDAWVINELKFLTNCALGTQ